MNVHARRVAAWTILLVPVVTVAAWTAYINVKFHRSGIGWGDRDIPFWPGGACIMTDAVWGFAALGGLLFGVAHLVSWALDNRSAS